MVLLAGVVLLVPSFASAAVIFQDNFDTCTQNCNSGGTTPPNSTSWDQWFSGGPVSVGGVSHYAGEISSPGRNGSGKSLKVWRNGQAYGYNGQYIGPLHKTNFAGTSENDIYLRYYIKWPSAMGTDNNTTYLKQWRITTTNPDTYHKELYLNMTPWFSSIQNAELRLFTSDGQCWHVLLNSSAVKALFDDQWHSLEFHIDLANDDLQFWVDGVSRYHSTSANLGGHTFKDFTHFPIGNTDNPVAWQSSWQALEVDDLVISTTYVGPDGTGGGTTPPPTDTTPPVISNPQPATTLTFGTVSTIMRVTTNENATCKYGTTNTTYASLPNTFTTTGGTTHSKTLTGLTNSSSVTYYVRCVDGSNNANTTSTVISVVVPGTTSVVNGACGSANGQSFSTLTSTSPNLCSAGTVGSFSGTGPWSWRCNSTNGGTYATCSATLSQQTTGTLLFSETFDNNSFSSRGWYDNPAQGTIASGGQSGNSLQWAWAQGATTPTNGGAMRKKFTPTDSLYVSFYVKFQSGWRGSQKAYHPHLIMIPSNLDADYTPLANNYLQTYIEFVSDVGSPYTIRPLLGLQDEKRVNTSNGTPPNNLTAVTENRSVNYCNTPVSSGALGTCYADNPYYSANTWKASNASLSTNVWHKVDVYFKMNTISNNKGQSNGIMQQWVDGTLVINRSDVLYRTAQDATKKWAQFVLAPYIGDGSPIAQTMWLDQLTVSTSGSGTGTTPPPSGGDTTPPAVPTGVTVS